MDDHDLILYHKEGFIPAPLETEEEFIYRVHMTKNFFNDPQKFLEINQIQAPISLSDKIKKPDKHWSRSLLLRRFDLNGDYLPAFFSNEKLAFFQGAATWIIENKASSKLLKLPLLQIRKAFRKGNFLKIYSLDEILAHETIHAARMGFDEKIYEEFLAYMSSQKILRRLFGPLFTSDKESYLFMGLTILVFLSWGVFSFNQLGYLSLWGLATFLGYALARLTVRRVHLFLTLKKLKRFFSSKEKSLSLLMRLTDKEIKKFAFWNIDKILSYVNDESKNSLRLRMIKINYFSK